VIVIIINLWPTECCHLDQCPAQTHVCQAETAPYQARTGKYGFNLLRYGIRRYVVVLGHLAQQQVTYTAADDVGLVAFFLQTANDFSGMRTQLLNCNSVFLERDNNVLSDDKFLKTCYKYDRSTP